MRGKPHISGAPLASVLLSSRPPSVAVTSTASLHVPLKGVVLWRLYQCRGLGEWGIGRIDPSRARRIRDAIDGMFQDVIDTFPQAAERQ